MCIWSDSHAHTPATVRTGSRDQGGQGTVRSDPTDLARDIRRESCESAHGEWCRADRHGVALARGRAGGFVCLFSSVSRLPHRPHLIHISSARNTPILYTLQTRTHRRIHRVPSNLPPDSRDRGDAASRLPHASGRTSRGDELSFCALLVYRIRVCPACCRPSICLCAFWGRACCSDQISSRVCLPPFFTCLISFWCSRFSAGLTGKRAPLPKPNCPLDGRCESTCVPTDGLIL